MKRQNSPKTLNDKKNVLFCLFSLGHCPHAITVLKENIGGEASNQFRETRMLLNGYGPH